MINKDSYDSLLELSSKELKEMGPDELDDFHDRMLSSDLDEDLYKKYPPIDFTRLFWAVIACASVIIIAILTI